MKKILMVLAAILICSTCLFISCQKDVGPDVPATLLVKATGETASKTYSYDYSYDNQGRFKKGVDEGKERSFFYDGDGHLIKDATVYADAPSNISEQEFVWKDGDMLKHIATFEGCKWPHSGSRYLRQRGYQP